VDDLEVPVVELFDEPSPRPSRRGRIGLVFAVVACAAALAVAASVVTDNGGHATPTHRRDPRAEIVAAVDATAGTGSFDMQFRTSETTTATHDAPALMSPISGSGSMTLNPHVMVATATVGGVGTVTTYVSSTSVWEVGGANYGTTGTTAGAGAPLSEFGDVVEGTIGPRAAGIAMMSLAGPTGYFNLSDAAITNVTKLSADEYEVTMDAGRLVDRPGMTDQEFVTALAGYNLLKEQGYVNTVVRVTLDHGFVARTQSAARFGDGGSVESDVTYSNFGRVAPIQLPGGS